MVATLEHIQEKQHLSVKVAHSQDGDHDKEPLEEKCNLREGIEGWHTFNTEFFFSSLPPAEPSAQPVCFALEGLKALQGSRR